MNKILKIVKFINAILYLCAAILAIISIALESSLINDLYWCFFGLASILLLFTSISQLITKKNCKK